MGYQRPKLRSARLTVLVILILLTSMSPPRSTIHQWLSSGADQKQLLSVRRPSTASPGEWSTSTLLDVAERGNTDELYHIYCQIVNFQGT